MEGAKHPANELTCLNNINKIYVESNREQCVSGREHSSHTTNICNCVHYIHSKMLNGREKVHSSRLQVCWFQEVKQNINYLNDLNSSVRGSLVPFSLQHPLGPFAFLSSVKKNYQLWFSPSSLNLISSGPSVLIHNQLQAFLSHFLICYKSFPSLHHLAHLHWITLVSFLFTRANIRSPLSASLCFTYSGFSQIK